MILPFSLIFPFSFCGHITSKPVNDANLRWFGTAKLKGLLSGIEARSLRWRWFIFIFSFQLSPLKRTQIQINNIYIWHARAVVTVVTFRRTVVQEAKKTGMYSERFSCAQSYQELTKNLHFHWRKVGVVIKQSFLSLRQNKTTFPSGFTGRNQLCSYNNRCGVRRNVTKATSATTLVRFSENNKELSVKDSIYSKSLSPFWSPIAF